MDWFKILFVKKGRKVASHAFFWVLLIIVAMTFEFADEIAPFSWRFAFKYFFSFTGFIILSYFNAYFLIPKYFKEKKYIYYAVLIISSILLTSLLTRIFLTITSNEFVLRHQNTSRFPFHMIFSSTAIVIGTSFIYFVGQWIKLQDITINLKEIEANRVRAELQTLKAQINPHFLFNTLNNLYSLSHDKSDKTPDMILKLSDLMSYVLHECQAEKVNILQEIDFIKNYIELEKLRFEENLKINIREDLNSCSIYIAPLLFIPFIENAFKHSGNKSNMPIEIDTCFHLADDKLSFTVSNTFEEQNQKTLKSESGIGIENVRKRLSLLYPERFDLKITQIDNKYNVELNLIVDANQVHNS